MGSSHPLSHPMSIVLAPVAVVSALGSGFREASDKSGFELLLLWETCLVNIGTPFILYAATQRFLRDVVDIIENNSDSL